MVIIKNNKILRHIKVRERPKARSTKTKHKNKGVIYLDETWIGKKVDVIER